jgi:hypothetical protein
VGVGSSAGRQTVDGSLHDSTRQRGGSPARHHETMPGWPTSQLGDVPTTGSLQFARARSGEAVGRWLGPKSLH